MQKAPVESLNGQRFGALSMRALVLQKMEKNRYPGETGAMQEQASEASGDMAEEDRRAWEKVRDRRQRDGRDGMEL